MSKKTTIFISWSKNKSSELAESTKQFLQMTLGEDIDFFFSPDMYKGTCVDNEIHKNLLLSEKCIVCITSENFKNPWLLYEAGVIYGANCHKSHNGIVIPILFEEIPEWSSWIDKPLNRYVPIQIQNGNNEFEKGKASFKSFLKELSEQFDIKIKRFDVNWQVYENKIKEILDKEQSIPSECKFLVNKLLENDNDNFSITSPEISRERILFHKGFTTHALTKILTEMITQYQGKYLWIYGRKNKKLMSREYDDFFRFLAEEGLNNGVDFRCFFPFPNSPATIKASSKDKSKYFDNELKISLARALELKNKFNLPVEKIFRLYKTPRKESIIRSDNAILYRAILCDAEGFPLPYTNSNFEVLSAIKKDDCKNSKGFKIMENLKSIWEDDSQSVPLTSEIFQQLYQDDN